MRSAAEDAGATIKIVALKIGGVTLKHGSKLKADGQLAGTPSVLFGAEALVLSDTGCAELLKDTAAVDFVGDAFGHLKAIGFSVAAHPLLDKAGVLPDSGVIALARNPADFIRIAAVRQWAREATLRTSA